MIVPCIRCGQELSAPDSVARGMDEECAKRLTSYWQNRVISTGVNLHGDVLDPEEIIFLERMLKRGELITDWIPKDKTRRQSTNDFVWNAGAGFGDGNEWELKTPKRPDYDAVKRRIRDDCAKYPPKTRFVIDFGFYSIDQQLAKAIQKYGKMRKLEGLFLMSENGRGLNRLI